MTEINYGPLSHLIGVWRGDKGLDIAPEPEGTERNPYKETLTFVPVGDATNAEEQCLAVLRYHQAVYRIGNNKAIHDQTGYWMWDEKNKLIMQSLVIPRAVALVAGGAYQVDGENTVLTVESGVDHPGWGLAQSPFMQEKAKTTYYKHHLSFNDETLSYQQTTMVDIYGKSFEHTDENTLHKIN